MNITLRKLVLLEQSIAKQEEIAIIQGYVTKPLNTDLKEKVTSLLRKVRSV